MHLKLVFDSINCIKNGYLSKMDKVSIKKSKHICFILSLLYKKGFIKNFCFMLNNTIDVFLKYTDRDINVFFREFKLISTLRRPMYSKNIYIINKYHRNVVILNTIKGYITNSELLLNTLNFFKKTNKFINIYNNKFSFSIFNNVNNLFNRLDLLRLNSLIFFDNNLQFHVKSSFFYFFKLKNLNFTSDFSFFFVNNNIKKSYFDFFFYFSKKISSSKNFSKVNLLNIFFFFFSNFVFYNNFISYKEFINLNNDVLKNKKSFDFLFFFNYIKTKKILSNLQVYKFDFLELSFYNFNKFKILNLLENKIFFKYFYRFNNNKFLNFNFFKRLNTYDNENFSFFCDFFYNSFDNIFFYKKKILFKIKYIKSFFTNLISNKRKVINNKDYLFLNYLKINNYSKIGINNFNFLLNNYIKKKYIYFFNKNIKDNKRIKNFIFLDKLFIFFINNLNKNININYINNNDSLLKKKINKKMFLKNLNNINILNKIFI